MKTHILIISLMWVGTSLMAQPVFENTYSESANICYLESKGQVYFSMDVINKQCLLYNMDHSLYKSISLPTPEGYYLSDIQYVSEDLFNNDELVELVYIYSKYVPTTGSYYYTFETKLINENGTVLETFPGAGLTSVIETIENGKKFLVYEYNYSVIPYRTYTHVYSLPESSTKSAEFFGTSPGLGNPYPNPAKHQVHIPVELPADMSSAQLVLYNLNGQKVISYPVSGSEEHILLPAKQLDPGTYLYSFQSDGWHSGSKKLVIH